MPRVIHFEIHVDQPQRAIKFYRELFGWDFHKWEGGQQDYWLITTGPNEEPGINGGMLPRQHPAAGEAINCYVCTVGVSSLDQSLETAGKVGATTVMPKTPIPGVGWLAYCKDTEGNIFGMMQPDQSAP